MLKAAGKRIKSAATGQFQQNVADRGRNAKNHKEKFIITSRFPWQQGVLKFVKEKVLQQPSEPRNI